MICPHCQQETVEQRALVYINGQPMKIAGRADIAGSAVGRRGNVYRDNRRHGAAVPVLVVETPLSASLGSTKPSGK
jgi:hypothetical protein